MNGVARASLLSLCPLVLGSLLAPHAAADDGLSATIYGKANVTAARIDDGTDKTWELTSNASRLGFKGAADLDGGRKAIYKLEFEVFFDDGDSDGNTFQQRNSYIGLQGSAGTLFVGKHDTALKMAQLEVDQLNDLPGGDIKNLLIGENRSDNVINYTSPSFGDAAVTIQLVLNEGAAIHGDGDRADGLADSVSSAVEWRSDIATVALAYDKDVVSSATVAGQSKVPFDTVRLTGQLHVDPFTVGAILERAKDTWNGPGHTSDSTTGFVLSGAWTTGKWTIRAQWGRSDMPIRFEQTDRNRQGALAVDLKLGGNSKLFGYYTNTQWKERTTGSKEEEKVVALGIEHKF